MKLRIDKTILSRNNLDKMHWSKKSRYSKEWEQEIWGATNGKPPCASKKMKVKVVAHRIRLLDMDNLVGGCKGLLDALKRLGMIVDDRPEYVEVEYQQIKARPLNAQTIIELEEMK